MKIGRNEPCLCGSGKKYKRCCLALDEQRAREQPLLPADGHPPVCDCCGHEMHGYNNGYVDDLIVDELDELSNQVHELIKAGKLDQAEAIGNELLTRFPAQIDGLEHLAGVYEARGDVEKAIEYFQKAAAFATLNPGFDQEAVSWFAGQARRLERRIKR